MVYQRVDRWMVIFAKWFHFHFLKHAPSERPILILLDGHLSHYRPKVIREAALAGVILCLAPNITHLAQPLDVTPFHSLKSHRYNPYDQYYVLPSRKDSNKIQL